MQFSKIIKAGLRVASVSQRARFSASLPAITHFQPLQSSSPLFSGRRFLSTSQPLREEYLREESEDGGLEKGEGFKRKFPPAETLFVGNLPFAASEDDLRTIFSPFGNVKRVNIAVHPDGTQRGYAHVEFSSKETAIRVIESDKEDPIYFLSRNLVLDFAPPRSRVFNEPYHTLYLFDFRGEEKDIEELFAPWSEDIKRVTLLRDGATGRSYGNGFVEFTDIDVAAKVLESMNNRKMPNGWSLNLNFAHPPRSRNTDRNEYGMRKKEFGQGKKSFKRRSPGSFGGDRGGPRRSDDWVDS
ncbi:hypothetical protein SERLA73DRAFT_176354 [Serpula lacrymans var. lacrymans S7.3]|uniref:RRM domain-containing protein n=2 Tax=Serpula lacrymans var. lacrymans TaxID=341189 RepID=F8PMR4_SERL3|nr:uncharacterized protein SERLADRAFT_459191 [Serpula lacrymans var. lacrymans S7.9]EGO02896.1 hypothetical protein SERLA73DRAFT_176354 [Serpula lacrymans var. lacrymans S7.3]EGO28587.1 hypothetical protein SERLADRAFT_459191 [Serpula lacrymans var. lacrymans S7.9]